MALDANCRTGPPEIETMSSVGGQLRQRCPPKATDRPSGDTRGREIRTKPAAVLIGRGSPPGAETAARSVLLETTSVTGPWARGPAADPQPPAPKASMTSATTDA